MSTEVKERSKNGAVAQIRELLKSKVDQYKDGFMFRDIRRDLPDLSPREISMALNHFVRYGFADRQHVESGLKFGKRIVWKYKLLRV